MGREPTAAGLRPTSMLSPARRVAITALSAIALLTAACRATGPVTDPPTDQAATSAQEAVDFQFQPTEVAVRFAANPDGTLQVTQDVILDAGPGVTGTVATYLKRELRIATSDEPDGWYFVTPSVADVAARDLTVVAHPHDLPAAITPGDDAWKISAATDHVFTAGRHRIELSYTVTGLLTTMNGRTVLIAPQGVLGAGWYSYGGLGDIARFSAQDGALSCGNERHGITEPTCPHSSKGLVLQMSDLDNGSRTSAGGDGYFFLPEPPGVTAAPVAAQFEARS